MSVCPSCSSRLTGLLLVGLAPLAATAPPTAAQLEQYRKDGSLAERARSVRALGLNQVRPDLALRARVRLEQAAVAQGLLAPRQAPETYALPPAVHGMPSTGTVKILVLCIDFSDYPHAAANTLDYMRGRLFGEGGGAAAPYDSLRNFYQRSSYGKLDIQGTVLGWYRPSYPRASMAATGDHAAQTRARQELIQEALAHYDAEVDYSQFDNDHDGQIDYLAVVWSGPNTGWGNFWWGYKHQWQASAGEPLFDGVAPSGYSWQWESSAPGGAFEPSTLIHETGHGMGLPDYYDYEPAVGPKGGLGGLDQMDGDHDHNCFSKWLLGWIEPTLVSGAAPARVLRATAQEKDALVLLPGLDRADPFSEMFMVENRQQAGNDVRLPGSGLLVWHVDARLKDGAFMYDNQYAEHKLIRLMEADGLEQIEQGKRAGAGVFYGAGRSFGPSTSPSSAFYSGRASYMGLEAISPTGPRMTCDVTLASPDLTPPLGIPGAPVIQATGSDLVLSWERGTAMDPETGISGYRLEVGTTPGGHEVFQGELGAARTHTLKGVGEDGVTYYARVSALNGAGLGSAWAEATPCIAEYPALDASVLDAPGLVFKTCGDQPWFAQSRIFHQGGSAAQSGPVQYGKASSLQTRVTGPCELSFFWKLNNPSGYAPFGCTLDGQELPGMRIDGVVDWEPKSIPVPPGSHLLRWTFIKYGQDSKGECAAWVDQVAAKALPPVVTALSPASAHAGVRVLLRGGDFRGTTRVTFNGIEARFTVLQPDLIEAVVPLGDTSGPVRVSTPAGEGAGAASFVGLGLPPAPVLVSFSPAGACVGTTVILEGSHLDAVARVSLGALELPFTPVDSTHLCLQVPAGASGGTWRVESPGGIATSAASFTVKGFDLNGAGGADLGDLARVALSFGKKSGETGFDGACDLNGDGVVDEQDAALLFANLD